MLDQKDFKLSRIVIVNISSSYFFRKQSQRKSKQAQRSQTVALFAIKKQFE